MAAELRPINIIANRDLKHSQRSCSISFQSCFCPFLYRCWRAGHSTTSGTCTTPEAKAQQRLDWWATANRSLPSTLLRLLSLKRRDITSELKREYNNLRQFEVVDCHTDASKSTERDKAVCSEWMSHDLIKRSGRRKIELFLRKTE